MFVKIAELIDAAEEALLDSSEACTDVEALVRIELANVLARAAVLAHALAAPK
jgi:hypothetical protein